MKNHEGIVVNYVEIGITPKGKITESIGGQTLARSGRQNALPVTLYTVVGINRSLRSFDPRFSALLSYLGLSVSRPLPGKLASF